MNSILPPEWAPQSAVMLTWPRADGDFAEHYLPVEGSFVRIAATISRFEPVHINCQVNPFKLRERLAVAGGQVQRIRIFQVESDDVWARDHGPITVLREDGQWVHLDFTFNGWGGKFPSGRDDQLTRRLQQFGAWKAPVETLDFVLEGGAIEVDGQGTLLTTERCLLAPTRNPQLDRAGIEAVLKPRLGVDRVLWLRRGDLIGDDTDGHIDTVARFCNPGLIAYQACGDRKDAHYDELLAMEAELRAFRKPDGSPYKLMPLPMPQAVFDEDGQRLPAGYANFLIVNGAVLVPVYGLPQDELALACLRRCFPGREIVPVDCRWLIRQYGSLHCVTMQIPATA